MEEIKVEDYAHTEAMPFTHSRVTNIDKYITIQPINKNSKEIVVIPELLHLVPKDENGDWLFIGDKVLYNDIEGIVENYCWYGNTKIPVYTKLGPTGFLESINATWLTKKKSYSNKNQYQGVNKILKIIKNDFSALKRILEV